jgi:hypothetical protein
MNKEIIDIKNMAITNYKQIQKLQRLIYLLLNNIKLYKGKNGGIYYKTKNSKIYIK